MPDAVRVGSPGQRVSDAGTDTTDRTCGDCTANSYEDATLHANAVCKAQPVNKQTNTHMQHSISFFGVLEVAAGGCIREDGALYQSW